MMNLNNKFIANIHDIYGITGDTWINNLPQIIRQLANQYDFQFIKPIDNLSFSFVALVMMNLTDRPAILKIAPDKEQIAKEVAWLKCFEDISPKILTYDESCNGFLMEYLQPGDSLKNLVIQYKDDDATKIICHIIRNLQHQLATEFQCGHLSELQNDFLILKGHFDAKLLAQAQSWFDELTSDTTHDVVLHGDLHHDNILSTDTQWKVIDPHGYRGDPVAEVGSMIFNPLDSYPTDKSLKQIIDRRLHILIDELPFDPKKIKAWAFCKAVLSAAWTLEGHSKVDDFTLAVATTIHQIEV